jgi:hypothetical protein
MSVRETRYTAAADAGLSYRGAHLTRIRFDYSNFVWSGPRQYIVPTIKQ